MTTQIYNSVRDLARDIAELIADPHLGDRRISEELLGEAVATDARDILVELIATEIEARLNRSIISLKECELEAADFAPSMRRQVGSRVLDELISEARSRAIEIQVRIDLGLAS